MSDSKNSLNGDVPFTYPEDQAPKRRGPIVTLARLWNAIPIVDAEDSIWLPEPHETFMIFFRHVLREDQWRVYPYDGDRWNSNFERIFQDPDEFNRLTIHELREIVSWEDHGETMSTGSLDYSVRHRHIQKALLRLAELVWPNADKKLVSKNAVDNGKTKEQKMDSIPDAHSYKGEAKPKRRGPLTTLAYLWAVVPIDRSYATDMASVQLLPEPHQTFISTFKDIWDRDDWLIRNINRSRWKEISFSYLHDPSEFKRLSVIELRDLISYFYNMEIEGGFENLMDQMTRTGQLQKILFRLSSLVSPELYE